MDQSQIERINFLAKKSKSEGLNEKEKGEQQVLRKAYIESWKNGVKATLSQASFVEADGSITPIRRKSDG
ncbi:conserved protein of unknown function [Petrocella atlantisensis]|uniref:UPF0291 protein PATL70BA_0249 n=1 Tax=Petrocella atlantisensis TaxID=2173034 RepID=A0A3P7P6Z2_9FIRM|nr:DUF896 domain-containing protein [Petrocella atlantisensis]PKM54100.1 MAG: DUF896 family protein [Firmicutes bacterium HGW-Firmicutes-5]VDN46093.1 conserved protein of unknown function [Petrocella atlantisensis]